MSYERRRRVPDVRGDAGMSIIEVLAASIILVIGVLGTLVLLDRANGTTVTTRAREASTNLMRELTEASRGIEYSRITDAGVRELLAAQPGLEDDQAGGAYTVTRRGFVFTIALDVCIMDEGRDGGGIHSFGEFCPESVAENAPRPGGSGTDSNPEDYKRIEVRTSWTERGRAYSQTQTSVVNNPGSVAGPAIRSLTLLGAPMPLPHVVDGADDGSPSWVVPGQKVSIHFTTSRRPKATAWLLDGVAQKPAPVEYDASGRAFTAEWDFSALYDGTYVIGAEAYDQYGVAGPSRSLSVTLNRHLPAKVVNVAGGRNGTTVELEWTANSERDIIGYTVERVDGEAPGQACPAAAGAISEATTCLDADPRGATTYRVRAWDRGPDGTPRAGAPSDPLTISTTNRPPAPVGELAATKNADGTTSLSWLPATDPDGDRIEFYRVYRDGTTPADRYDTLAGDVLTPDGRILWTDYSPDGVARTYHVTAVDTTFAEAPFQTVEVLP